MIKYLELTAPDSMDLRGAKIIRTEVAEGDTVKTGDALFTISNNGKEQPLPASMDGRVVELIARDGDGLSRLTPLILFETNVEDPPKPDVDTASEQEAARDKNVVTVKVPDIGEDAAKVVEILVKVGDHISVDDPIISLESDKANMEVPSTAVGTVHAIKVALNDELMHGDAVIEVLRDAAGGATIADAPASEASPKIASQDSEDSTNASNDTGVTEKPTPSVAQTTSDAGAAGNNANSEIEIAIPDIGGGSAKVVEILVKVGDSVEYDQALIALESDKASMEVPSSAAGEVLEIKLKLDDEVSEGTVVVVLRSDAPSENQAADTPATTAPTSDAKATDDKPADIKYAASAANPATQASNNADDHRPNAKTSSTEKSHASPSIRRLARELGADLTRVEGSGRKGRVTKEDVKAWVKQQLTANVQNTQQSAGNQDGKGIPAIKNPDFSKFGETQIQPLNRIKQLTAQNLHRSWLNVPHVTHSDEANVADLESFRKQLNAEYAKANQSIKLSPLAFIVKAVVNGLQRYPQFNSSLSEDGTQLILKKYFNIGIAVETPDGLVVPVIKSADGKSVAEIAQEMAELAAKARDKKLTMADMSGACFTISSLGGIGGTGFTPIVNAPEVAILGVSRTKIQPFWNGSEFIPAPFLPLSLSYDHRVIDGAEAARFARHIASVLEDVRRLTV